MEEMPQEVSGQYSAGHKEILRQAVTEEKLDISAQLEARLKKLLCLMAIQCGVAKSRAHIDIKLLKLQPNKTKILHNHLPPDYEARIQYCRWFQESVDFLIWNLHFILMRHGYVNSQNNIYWSRDNPHE
jgi:hypothetical protein